MHFLSIEQAVRGTKLAFAANVPVAWWGPPGIGKSSAIAQIAEDMSEGGDQYELFDLRLSDKEPSDVGGIPFPVDDPNPENPMKKVLEFLVTDLLPFNTRKKAIVLLDEFDRADLSVQNVALQIILDRKVNGHELSPFARIVVAGNGSTDVGTSPLSKAAANRICHLYIETGSNDALKGWLNWAAKSDISPILMGFAGYRQEVFGGIAGKGKVNIEELAYPTPRSFVYADKLISIADKVPFPTKDILPAMVAGCVGKAAAAEFMGYRDIFQKQPTIEQIVANPNGVDLPKNPAILFAYKRQLAIVSKGDLKTAEAVGQYALRWDDEAASDMFRLLKENTPEIAKSQVYKDWTIKRERPPLETSTGQPVSSTVGSTKAWCMACRKQQPMKNPTPTTMKNGKAATKGNCGVCGGLIVSLQVSNTAPATGSIPTATGFPVLGRQAVEMLAKAVGGKMDGAGDVGNYVNRMRVKSSTGMNHYTISQNTAQNNRWECSCKGWTNNRKCRHLDEVNDALRSLTAGGSQPVKLATTGGWYFVGAKGNPNAARKVGQAAIRRGGYSEVRITHSRNYRFEAWVR